MDAAKDVVEVEVFAAQAREVVAEGFFALACPDVLPDEIGLELIEDEAADEAVFGRLEKRGDLLGRAGEQSRKASCNNRINFLNSYYLYSSK